MSYSVQINDNAGGQKPETLALQLHPGEKRTTWIRVVNLGDPSNLSIKVLGSIIGALKPRKANHYIVLEESISLSVQMPNDVDMLSGEIILRSDEETTSIPVTLSSQATLLNKDEIHDEEEGLAVFKDRINPDDDDEDEPYNPSYNSSNNSRSWGNEDDRFDVSSGSDRYGGEDQEDTFVPTQDMFIRPKSRGSRELVTLVIPILLIIALIVVLMLTFYTRSIPEYPGALISAMLIVTLIIYGAATMLKA